MHSRITIRWIPIFCILCFGTISCKKFLATYSQNNSFIETADDLDELLVGDGYYDTHTYFYSVPEMRYSMDDDIEAIIPQTNRQYKQENGFHYWQAQPRMNTEGQISNTDPFFNDVYSRIARINTILNNVPSLREKGQPANALNRIAGEAHFLRAYYYFVLVNFYGKPYKPATAANDFGVPLKTDPAVHDQFTFRSSTQQVYSQIIADLLEAEKELAGANRSSTLRANQAAAQALLSRVYLFLENYERALHYADQVIGQHAYRLTDLNMHTDGADFLNKNSPEVIFTMGRDLISDVMVISEDVPARPGYRASDNLTMGYLQEDLRRQVFFIQNSQGFLKAAKKRNLYGVDDVSDLFLVRLSEIYLNKAEALAALDRFQEARNTLQEFRLHRFKPTELPPIHAEGAALMTAIRDERRLELCFETHRWFDLRRYAVNSKYPYSKSIQHRSIVFAGNGYIDNGYYELGPYEQDAAAWIVPIANDEIAFNQGRLSNEPRPDRPLKQ